MFLTKILCLPLDFTWDDIMGRNYDLSDTLLMGFYTIKRVERRL